MLERNSTQVASTALAIQNVVMPSTDKLYMSNELDMRSTRLPPFLHSALLEDAKSL